MELSSLNFDPARRRAELSGFDSGSQKRALPVDRLENWQPRDVPVNSPPIRPGALFTFNLHLPGTPAYLLGWAADSDQAAGFEVELIDVSSGYTYSTAPIPTRAGFPAVGNYPGGVASLRNRQRRLAQPALLPRPGVVRVCARNLAGVDARLSLVLFLAAPVDAVIPEQVRMAEIAVLKHMQLPAAVSMGTGTVEPVTPSSGGGGGSTAAPVPQLVESIQFNFTAAGETQILPANATRAQRIVAFEVWIAAETDFLIKARPANPDDLVIAALGVGRILEPEKKSVAGQFSYSLPGYDIWELKPGEALFVESTNAVQMAGSVFFRVLV